MSEAQHDALVEEATVDCYNEAEQITPPEGARWIEAYRHWLG